MAAHRKPTRCLISFLRVQLLNPREAGVVNVREIPKPKGIWCASQPALTIEYSQRLF